MAKHQLKKIEQKVPEEPEKGEGFRLVATEIYY